jgi:protein N-terminal glutamine amidohydrolase
MGRKGVRIVSSRWEPLRLLFYHIPCISTRYYCEENAVRLAMELEAAGMKEVFVLFFSSARTPRRVAFWTHGPDAVVWDYHVAVLTMHPDVVWDLDSALPFPCDLGTYCERALRPTRNFPTAAARVVPLSSIHAFFSSDRRHMRTSPSPPPKLPCLTHSSDAAAVAALEPLGLPPASAADAAADDDDAVSTLLPSTACAEHTLPLYVSLDLGPMLAPEGDWRLATGPTGIVVPLPTLARDSSRPRP